MLVSRRCGHKINHLQSTDVDNQSIPSTAYQVNVERRYHEPPSKLAAVRRA